MESRPFAYRLAALLVRRRNLLFWLSVAAALVCAGLMPFTRINADMTTNLPDSSPMRKGLAILEEAFPQMDMRMPTLRVLFLAEPPADSLQNGLQGLLEGARLVEVRQHEAHTLYQFMLPVDSDIGAVKKAVRARFEDRVAVEVDDKSGIPGNLLVMLGAGVAMVFLILFLMCPSLVETLLFLLTIGIAVLVNMGTNALLPSVRLLTHTLSAVLQLALSMDYAIILMSRYRQQKEAGLEKEAAMTTAVANAAPAILSSALTTVAGLMMLVFMQLRIGEDLGLVLSKGVICSLIATFTVLPALILRFEKGIKATEKRVPVIPTEGLARFQMRFRWPLSLLFIGLFIGSWFLQRQTKISYSVAWSTPITDEFPETNNILLLYPTAEESVVGALTDSLVTEEAGLSCLSYPSIALKPRTATELGALLADLAPEVAATLPPEALDLGYYAATHPDRTERMRLDELKPAADSLLALARRILPAEQVDSLASRFDMDALMRQFAAEPAIPAAKPAKPVKPVPAPMAREEAPQTLPEPVIAAEQPQQDTPDPEPVEEAPVDQAEALEVEAPNLPEFFTREEILQPRTAAEMAELLQYDSPGQFSFIYRLGGVSRKGTMNMHEFLTTVSKKVLGNRFYASMVPAGKAAAMKELLLRVEEVLAQEPPPAPPAPVEVPAETPAVLAVDTLVLPTAPPDTAVRTTPVAPPPVIKRPEPEPLTPLEVLADLAFSGRRLTATQCCQALQKAGIPVKQEEIDLLYLYSGFREGRDTTVRLSLLDLAGSMDRLMPGSGMQQRMQTEFGALRGPEWSVAVLQSELPVESEETFSFLEQLQTRCRASVAGDTYLIGYSPMYKEIKEGFPRDLLFLTLLTIVAIFLIVAWSFKSLVIPFLLIPSVLTGVWLNVFASGLGGETMLFLAYLIVQGILMGASIDYSILFTHYYRGARATQEPAQALSSAYRGSVHTILTSGLILTLTPWVMTLVVTEPMIFSILRSISIGAFATLLVILFVLPAFIALLDRWISK